MGGQHSGCRYHRPPLFNEGRFDARKIIALTGSEVTKPQYYHSILGASIQDLTAGKLKMQ